MGRGREVVVAVGISQSVDAHARAYVRTSLPNAGMLLSFTPPGGPSQRAVAGGSHAASLAEQITYAVRACKVDDPDAVVHLFAACPNVLLFFLGQQHQALAPCVVYEFDFDRKGDRSYQPSFVVE